MAFMGEGVELVRDAETGEERGEVEGVGDGDDVVGDAVEDEGGWEVRGGLGVPGRDEAAGDVDDAAEFWDGLGSGLGA